MLNDKLNRIAPAAPVSVPAANRKGDWTPEKLREMLDSHYMTFKGREWKYSNALKNDSRFDGNLIFELEGCPCCDRGERYGSPAIWVSNGILCFTCHSNTCQNPKKKTATDFLRLIAPELMKPVIRLGTNIKGIVLEALDSLKETEVYQRGNRLVRVDFNPPKPKYAMTDFGAPRLVLLPQSAFLEILTSAANWEKWTRDGWTRCLPSKDVIAAIYSRGNLPAIKVATGVVSRPILLPSGEIVATPGYHLDTGLFLDVANKYPPPMDTARAIALLLDIWIDFPFESPAHQSACLAALLTLLCRNLIDGSTPFFPVDGNRSGVGKGLLTDTFTMIAEGRRASRCSVPDEAELRKALTAIAISGQNYILFDNVKGRFGGGVLEGAMTTGIFEARILGVNEIVKLPLNVTWLATANDAAYTRDMIRRTCPIMLSTDVENPEARSAFKYSRLLDHIACHRAELVIAAMSIVGNFIAADRPDQKLSSWGGFEQWSDLIRGAIVWAGLADPIDALEVLRSSVIENVGSLTSKLIDAWTFDSAVTVKAALISIESEPDKYTALAALIDGRPDKDRTPAEYLGKLLRGARGQVISGRCIQRDSSDSHRPKWFVEIKGAAAA